MIEGIGIVVGILVAIIFVAKSLKNPSDPIYKTREFTALMNTANRYGNAQDFSTALIYYKKAIDDIQFSKLRKKLQANVIMAAARCCITLGHLDEAEKFIGDAEKLSPVKLDLNLTKAMYYQRKSYADEAACEKMEEYFRAAAEENPNYLARAMETYMQYLNFDKAAQLAAEHLERCRGKDVYKAYTNLLIIYRLTGNLDAIDKLAKKARNARLKQAAEWEDEYRAHMAENLRHNMERGEPVSATLARLKELYQGSPKKALRLVFERKKDIFAIAKSRELAGTTIEGTKITDDVFCLNLSKLDSAFKQENHLPESGALRVLLGEEKPLVIVEEKEFENFFCGTVYSLEETTYRYRFNDVNYPLLEKCLNGKTNELLSYNLIRYFINYYYVKENLIGSEAFTNTDGMECEKLISLYTGKHALHVTKINGKFEARIFEN